MKITERQHQSFFVCFCLPEYSTDVQSLLMVIEHDCKSGNDAPSHRDDYLGLTSSAAQSW